GPTATQGVGQGIHRVSPIICQRKSQVGSGCGKSGARRRYSLCRPGDELAGRTQRRMTAMLSRITGPMLLLLAGQMAHAASTPACDRACLAGLITQYADAVVAHDHTR